ncbi:hypothetical protein [Shewanella sp.]|uniref:hypothetical protein n=1 Tax=Shewanella sp. TaxID=50422 RepID=UPI00258EA942|nr:hypothetical protein [Shewanella sp.]MCJ8304059.1 hypothetical protein [Shewanella sp.]
MKTFTLVGVILLSILLNMGCASNEASSNDESAVNDEELVCEFTAKTGSNLKKKRCMTKSLAKELGRESKHDLREAMRKGQTQAHTTL